MQSLFKLENEWKMNTVYRKNGREMERVLENSFVTYLYFWSKYQIQKIIIKFFDLYFCIWELNGIYLLDLVKNILCTTNKYIALKKTYQGCGVWLWIMKRTWNDVIGTFLICSKENIQITKIYMIRVAIWPLYM
jgi:hypothetical protein